MNTRPMIATLVLMLGACGGDNQGDEGQLEGKGDGYVAEPRFDAWCESSEDSSCASDCEQQIADCGLLADRVCFATMYHEDGGAEAKCAVLYVPKQNPVDVSCRNQSVKVPANAEFHQVPPHAPGTVCYTPNFWCWEPEPKPHTSGLPCTCYDAHRCPQEGYLG